MCAEPPAVARAIGRNGAWAVAATADVRAVIGHAAGAAVRIGLVTQDDAVRAEPTAWGEEPQTVTASAVAPG